MRKLVSVLGLAVAVSTVAGMSGTASAASAWRIVPSQNASTEDGFGSVAVLSPTNVWAVGSAYNVVSGSLQETPLIEHHTGSGWQIVTSPSPAGYPYAVLSSVSAASASDIWAVGEYNSAQDIRSIFPLVEHYDGTAWSMVTVPQPYPRGGLSGVAALSSTNVWAVGSSGTRSFSGVTTNYPLIEHYDGSTWTDVALPGPVNGTLDQVAAASPTDVWAVGTLYTGGNNQAGFAVHYDGTGWTQVALPAPPASASSTWTYTNITVTPSGQFWVTGSGFDSTGLNSHSFAEHYAAGTWSLVPLPDKGTAYTVNQISGIAAASDSDIWAVGNAGTGNQRFVTLVEHYDGTAWSVVASPNANTADGLDGVATGGGSVWAVGSTAPANSTNQQTLTETTP